MSERAPLVRVQLKRQHTLEDYAAVAQLATAAGELKAEAARLVPRLTGRTIWHVSSTAAGGGVAEMMPSVVGLLRDLGVRTEWAVIGASDPAFFALTKRLHNLIHGVGNPELGYAEREVFERVARENAAQLHPLLRPGDILVVHDPQPLPLAALLRPAISLLAVWRCHIGLDERNVATRAVWDFLAPYLAAYDQSVFSAPEYIPDRLSGRATVMSPSIDPFAPKNRDLSLTDSVEVLCRSALVPCPGPTLRGPYQVLPRRAFADGRLVPLSAGDGLGLLTRPTVTQISRWDRLKGFLPLMRAFASLKASPSPAAEADPLHRRRLDLVRLVLAGPDPSGVADDPESVSVFDELRAAYATLDPAVHDDIALIVLPMRSVEENALMVNVLQRASTIVVQNSLREGFGLTIAEAMWKRVPVLSNGRAAGPRQQVRDDVDGRLIRDPEDAAELRQAMDQMLASPEILQRMGAAGQRRVYQEFLVLSQLRSWLRLLAAVADSRVTRD